MLGFKILRAWDSAVGAWVIEGFSLDVEEESTLNPDTLSFVLGTFGSCGAVGAKLCSSQRCSPPRCGWKSPKPIKVGV